MKLKCLNPITTSLCITGALTLSLSRLSAADDATVEDLKARVAALEELLQKEGISPTNAQVPKFVSGMSHISLSGFVQASYFYNTQRPADHTSDGYLWNTRDNSFSLNKVKVTLASDPVERSGEKWGAGFRTSLIWGEDSPVLNTGSPSAGFEALREAYVELNVPIGTGLNIKAGQLISLLNWESGDGGAANPNFSQGYQWFYTGNGPSAGVQLGYALSDKVELKVRVHNGLYAGPVSSTSGKAVMGSIGFKPTDTIWFNLIGFGGKGTATLDVDGGSVIGGWQVTKKLGTGYEFDYFHFDPKGGSTADLWSIGGWVWYDFTPKVGVALRADYLDDKDGFGINGVNLPGASREDSAILSPDANGNLGSVTLTLNLRPTPNIKIQPEIRYDYTSYNGGLDGKKDRFIVGIGASYLF
jgi:hypothetical protein